MGVTTRALRWCADGTLSLVGAGSDDDAIEALLFDLGGTLDADGIGWGERFESMLRAELRDVPNTALAAALEAGEQAVLRHPRAGELGLEEMISLHVATQLDRLGASNPARVTRIAKRFYEETSAALSGRRGLLERLSSRLPLGVVSNGCGNTALLLRECGLADLFQCVVDSTRVNAWKPDPRIFSGALASLGRAAERVAMVGDRLDRDVEGAVAAGLRAIWVSGARALDASHPLASSVGAVVQSVDALEPEPPS
jgi:putative hydrolase of the HAD superfamily